MFWSGGCPISQSLWARRCASQNMDKAQGHIWGKALTFPDKTLQKIPHLTQYSWDKYFPHQDPGGCVKESGSTVCCKVSISQHMRRSANLKKKTIKHVSHPLTSPNLPPQSVSFSYDTALKVWFDTLTILKSHLLLCYPASSPLLIFWGATLKLREISCAFSTMFLFCGSLLTQGTWGSQTPGQLSICRPHLSFFLCQEW